MRWTILIRPTFHAQQASAIAEKQRLSLGAGRDISDEAKGLVGFGHINARLSQQRSGRPTLRPGILVAEVGEGLRFLWGHAGVRSQTVIGFLLSRHWVYRK